jgi:hypothetical protein
MPGDLCNDGIIYTCCWNCALTQDARELRAIKAVPNPDLGVFIAYASPIAYGYVPPPPGYPPHLGYPAPSPGYPSPQMPVYPQFVYPPPPGYGVLVPAAASTPPIEQQGFGAPPGYAIQAPPHGYAAPPAPPGYQRAYESSGSEPPVCAMPQRGEGMVPLVSADADGS